MPGLLTFTSEGGAPQRVGQRPFNAKRSWITAMIRVYIETSALGFYYDDRAPRERDAVRALLRRIQRKELEGFTSRVTQAELEAAPSLLAEKLLSLVKTYALEAVPSTAEAEDLAEAYLAAGIIPRTHRADAVHVAIAVIQKANVIATYNLKHMANYRAVTLVNNLNRERGLPSIDIRTPEQLL